MGGAWAHWAGAGSYLREAAALVDRGVHTHRLHCVSGGLLPSSEGAVPCQLAHAACIWVLVRVPGREAQRPVAVAPSHLRQALRRVYLCVGAECAGPVRGGEAGGCPAVPLQLSLPSAARMVELKSRPARAPSAGRMGTRPHTSMHAPTAACAYMHAPMQCSCTHTRTGTHRHVYTCTRCMHICTHTRAYSTLVPAVLPFPEWRQQDRPHTQNSSRHLAATLAAAQLVVGSPRRSGPASPC